MHDEPETRGRFQCGVSLKLEIRFQREMSLKPTAAEEGILLVNDYQHAEPREADVGRDGGVRRRQQEVELVSGQVSGPEPGANDPFDCPLDEDSPGERGAYLPKKPSGIGL